MFLFVTYYDGMPGFEAMWTDLSRLQFDVSYIENLEDHMGVSLPIVGCFRAKGDRTGCHMISITGSTTSGVEFFKWMQHFI